MIQDEINEWVHPERATHEELLVTPSRVGSLQVYAHGTVIGAVVALSPGPGGVWVRCETCECETQVPKPSAADHLDVYRDISYGPTSRWILRHRCARWEDGALAIRLKFGRMKGAYLRDVEDGHLTWMLQVAQREPTTPIGKLRPHIQIEYDRRFAVARAAERAQADRLAEALRRERERELRPDPARAHVLARTLQTPTLVVAERRIMLDEE